MVGRSQNEACRRKVPTDLFRHRKHMPKNLETRAHQYNARIVVNQTCKNAVACSENSRTMKLSLIHI